MTKDSIALIGFMATGKSTIGKALKVRLGKDYQFIETDQIIIEITGKSIPKIFTEEGEAKFRDYEHEACKRVARIKKKIISCGGGVVLNESNIKLLKQTCYMVLLTATPEEIFNRVIKEGKENRPVINKNDPFQEIKDVLQHRKPFYNSSAEIMIDTTGKSIEAIVEEILKHSKLQG